MVGYYWRRAKYQWLNRRLVADLSIAVILFAAVFLLTLILPKASRPLTGNTNAKLALFLSLPPLLMVVIFWYIRCYLIRESAYENLQIANRPTLGGLLEIFLRLPCSTVVIFAVLSGTALSTWGWGSWELAVRASLVHIVTPLPPVAIAIQRIIGEEAIPWPAWLDLFLSLVYSTVVFALVSAWFRRYIQRQNYVASLFTDEARGGSPYGFRPGSSPDHLQPEPHEQVLLMQADRIGPACLPYLRLELSAPEWQSVHFAPDRCRGAIAVVERIFARNGNSCWENYPQESDWLANWLLSHLDRLVNEDNNHPNFTFDHRLGEVVKAVAAVLASGQTLPQRPTPTSRGAYNEAERIGRFRTHLRYLFSRSPKRHTLLIAACDAAERLGTPEDLRLLDEQSRHLDVQAGFTISQTDRILQTRDRVLAKEPLRSELLAKLRQRIERLGLEPLPVQEGKPLLFRRPKDNAVMALIVAGSFCRGDDHAEETSPKRRVYLSSYLIDVEPVSQDSFRWWVETQGGVLRVDRGFFPVQGLPDDVPQDRPYASHVTWFAGQAYAKWVLEGGHLPTEAQWEKAARGSEDDRRYPTGDIWVDEPISPYGIRLCHMLEWTLDAYDRLAYRHNPIVFDPRMESVTGAGDEAMRVVRGRLPGSSVASYSLVTRLGREPVTGAFDEPVGFRVAVDLEVESQG